MCLVIRGKCLLTVDNRQDLFSKLKIIVAKPEIGRLVELIMVYRMNVLFLIFTN